MSVHLYKEGGGFLVIGLLFRYQAGGKDFSENKFRFPFKPDASIAYNRNNRLPFKEVQ